MHVYSTFLIASDSSNLGRLDYDSLSTQALMEIFIAGIENRDVICGSAETPDDFDKWDGFEYSGERSVEITEEEFKITWMRLHLVGTIDLQWLPPAIRWLNIFENELKGSLNLTALPESMEVLDCKNNAFSGEIDLRNLPAEIAYLGLAINQLSGSLNLEQLPQSIRELYLHSNRFSGTVCLRHLPSSLNELTVSRNKLSGTVDLTRLPATLKILWLGGNQFEGHTDFSQLPDGLDELSVSYTNLSGEITVGDQTTYFGLQHSKVQLIE